MNDLRLDNDDDMIIKNGDFAVGESDMDDVSIVLRLNPGELKSDPVLGPALLRTNKSTVRPEKIEATAALHITRAGYDYNAIKGKIKMNLKTF